jgi:hypothetical protein
VKANRAAAVAQQRLDGLVQATQDRAAAEAAAAPLVDGNGLAGSTRRPATWSRISPSRRP